MELKQTGVTLRILGQGVLIVPYGIETFRYHATAFAISLVLIVPYGIETKGGGSVGRIGCLF